jgi:hypothetical protein
MSDDDNSRPVSLADMRLFRAGEVAYQRYLKQIAEMRMAIYPMVRGLIAARRQYPDEAAFAAWLDQSAYARIDEADRAALFKLTEYPLHELLQFLGKTQFSTPCEVLAALKCGDEM